MQGKARKIVQAILYEAIAVACVAPALELAFGAGMAQSTVLSVLMSGVAMSWNMLYNWVFERWEARQPQRKRTLLRRLLQQVRNGAWQAQGVVTQDVKGGIHRSLVWRIIRGNTRVTVHCAGWTGRPAPSLH